MAARVLPAGLLRRGPGPFRYLLYKDVNRQVRLTDGTGRLRADGGERAVPRAAGHAASEPLDLVVAGERVLVDGAFAPAEVGVRDGVIARIAPLGSGLAATASVRLADDEVLIPGLVDTHVHVNEPGRTEWEGFASATRAAAAGGVTTIVDMPLNSIPPTTTVAALEIKRRAADGAGLRRRRLLGRTSCRATSATSRRSSTRACSGSSASSWTRACDEFPAVTADEMEAAMAVLAATDSLLIVHAEDARSSARRRIRTAGRTPTSSRRARVRPSMPRSPPSSRQPRAPARGRTSCT